MCSSALFNHIGYSQHACLFHPDSVSKQSAKPVWHISTAVYTPDNGQKICPKQVEFYSKNKFEKLVHLVGFIIRIYHDAWSSECQSTSTKIVYCLASRNLSQNEDEYCLRSDCKGDRTVKYQTQKIIQKLAPSSFQQMDTIYIPKSLQTWTEWRMDRKI